MRDRGDFALDSLPSIEPRTCASMAKSLLRALPTPSWVCRCWNGADLAAVARGGLLSAFSSSLLLEAMERCETGPNRIKELVPAGTRISHKTGLIANPLDPAIGAPLVTSDVGLNQLPPHDGRVGVARYHREIAHSRERGHRDRIGNELDRAHPDPQCAAAIDIRTASWPFVTVSRGDAGSMCADSRVSDAACRVS